MSLTVKVKIGKVFIKELNNAVEDEFKKAVDKWGVTLSNDEKKDLIVKSFEQLQSRIEAISKNPWKIGESIVYTIPGATGEYELPSKESKSSGVMLVRASDGWKASSEPKKGDPIPLGTFHKVAKEEITNWLRTAVFYGVGSYKT